MSGELITLLVGASPIAEVRGALPLAIGVFHFSALKAYSLATLGNIIPVLPVLIFLRYGSQWLMRVFPLVRRFLTWLFERTRRLHGAKFENVGVFALFVFVAIPLPLTGIWTGCIAAFLFGLPFWKSAFAISLGAATAGLVVLALTLGVVSFI
jgi:uncharacterized membrane protein